jgi:HK97 family phage portal protein
MDDAQGSALLLPQNSTLRNPVEDWLRDALTGGRSDAGVAVNANSVRGLPGAWYSICKIAGHIGTLPLNCYRRVGENSELARNHPGDYLMRKRSSDLCQSPAVFRETLQHHALLHGNGRAFIARNGRGDPIELIIIDPLKWAIVVSDPVELGGVLIPSRKWHVRIDNPRVQFADENCLHIMGLSNDGIAGLGVVDAAKQALGIAIGQQRQRASSVKNGARVQFLLAAPAGAFRQEGDAQKFIDAFNAFHSGADNANRVGLLREGIEPRTVGMNGQQAQEIEQAQFSRQDIALLFQIESMLGDNSTDSYNSLEQRNRAYLTNCLMRWITRWEQECGIKLLTSTQYDSDEYYFRFVVEALLRGTTKERYETYQIARQIGVLSANEVRELEDMNERDDPGGDSYANPAITPSGAPDTTISTEEPASEDEQVDTPALARLRRFVTASVSNLVQTEINRVTSGAGQLNFCGWLDQFYAGWQSKIDAVITSAGGATGKAETWCNESRERLLAVAGRTDKRGLHEAIRAETTRWGERTEQLVNDILGG